MTIFRSFLARCCVGFRSTVSGALAALILSATGAAALETFTLTLPDDSEDGLERKLRAASVVRQAQGDGSTDPQDLFAAALAEYRRLTEVLYANGYYSGVINVRIDGREAALIPATARLQAVRSIAISITPGRPFTFGRAEIRPLPQTATLPEGFRAGARAGAQTVLATSAAAQTAWRDAGHAKVRVSTQDLSANHATNRLDVTIGLNPGPVVRFGSLLPEGGTQVRPTRIHEIAGLPVGQEFSPAEVTKAANRLRRSGAFRSVALSEADTLGPDNTLDIAAALVDAPQRRFGAGVELSNQQGLQLSGFWLHRNLFGGAERFRIEGEISDITGSGNEIDYRLGTRLERPASFGPDTTAFLRFDLSSEQEPLYDLDAVELGLGASRILSDHLTGSVELAFSHARTTDAFGTRDFTLAQLPLSLDWDQRSSELNPTTGHLVKASFTPYLGLAGAESGGQFKLDSRLYRSLGNDRLVAAGRLQFGSVVGSSLAGTAPDFLFQSGGGGTVRGQPYQSLGVASGGSTSGGRSFLGLSGELRAKVSDSISLVGFADAGYIGAESLYDGSGNWHAGAGLGLRYDTSVGPIRLDVAAPISGDTGDGVQVYIGIGQAF